MDGVCVFADTTAAAYNTTPSLKPSITFLTFTYKYSHTPESIFIFGLYKFMNVPHHYISVCYC